jgi:hypothetical protein
VQERVLFTKTQCSFHAINLLVVSKLQVKFYNFNLTLHHNYLNLIAGVLIAKKSLFKHDTPNGCGGGTVFFVTKEDHRYVQVC